MPQGIERFFAIPWEYCITRIRHIWLSLFSCVFEPAHLHDLRPPTDQQREHDTNEFIASIDTDAICSLASRQNGGLSCSIRNCLQGSFNVCFVIEFADGTTRLVRLPIEPVVHNVWDKVRSEVCTMSYLNRHTDIPIPRVYAYGRSRLRRDNNTYQVFMIMEHITGQPLTKKTLRDSSKERRSRLLGELVDIFAQLRELEFCQGGSLIHETTWADWAQSLLPREQISTPQSIEDSDTRPVITGAFLMRKNELETDGYVLPRLKANSANEFLREQYHLLRCTWEMPCEELEREEAERQEFALHFLKPEKVKRTLGIEASTSAKEQFYLSHPDLRSNNIIVDDELHICGIIDWEFSVTVPPHAFLPPSWLTGYGGSIGTKMDISSEFMNVLSSRKHQSRGHSRLAQEWRFEDDLRLPMAYIFLEPSNLVLLFYKCIYPKLYNGSCDKVIYDFFRRFDNQELRMGLERRLRASERYTQYLKDNNLYDPETEMKWQQHYEWVKDVHHQLGQLQGWSNKVQDELRRLDGERAERRRL